MKRSPEEIAARRERFPLVTGGILDGTIIETMVDLKPCGPVDVTLVGQQSDPMYIREIVVDDGAVDGSVDWSLWLYHCAASLEVDLEQREASTSRAIRKIYSGRRYNLPARYRRLRCSE